jgi:hypothetical protein
MTLCIFKTALPAGVKDTDFCPEETARNVTWKQTYHGHQDKRLCPNGTIGKVWACIFSSNVKIVVWTMKLLQDRIKLNTTQN